MCLRLSQDRAGAGDSGQQYGVKKFWRLRERVGINAKVGYWSPRARKGEISIVSLTGSSDISIRILWMSIG